MVLRIEWDKFEVALLLDACEKVLSRKGSKPEIVSELSAALRSRAVSNGREIDDTYRNENGISLQMTKMDYLLTDGKTGLPGASKLFADIAKLRRDNPEKFYDILKLAKEQIEKKEAKALVGNKERFSTWLSSNSTKKYSPELIIKALEDGSDYCKSHGISKESFWDISEEKRFSAIASRLAGMRLFRLTHKKLSTVLDKAIPLYKEYLAERNTSATEIDTENDVDELPVSSQISGEPPSSYTADFDYSKVDMGDESDEPTSDADSSISLEAFKHYLNKEKGLAERTAGNYWTSIRMIEEYIQRHQLDFSLLNTDAACAQRIFDLLMARPDFEQINIQRHHQYSAALTQYVSFLTQGGYVPTDRGQRRTGEKTIIETVFDVLRQAGKPMTVSEIYQAIIRDNLYSFGAQDPQAVVYSKVSLACRQTENRIEEGKDVLIKSVEDGRNKFQVMTAAEASIYLQKQKRESELASASSWPNYEAVLKRAFPKGFQKESGLDIKKLRKRWMEIHGEELKDTDETVRLQLASHCIDTGKRWYLAELLLTDEDRQTVLRYIDRVLSSGKPVLYYSSIYAALEHQLESTVLTADLLVSYLFATCQDRYILREHYLTNDRDTQVQLSEEIKDVMLAHGRPIHTDELKQALHYLPPDQVEREIHIHPEFIMDAFHMYFHESMADLTEQELEQIAAIIQEELDDQGYMIGDWIQSKLTLLYPETAERLSFLSLLGVRGAVAYKLRDRFTFSGPVITPKGTAMNMIDIFAMFCQHHTPFTLDELAAFAKECDSTIYLDTVHKNCARVSETNFVAAEAVHWDIPHVDAAIALHCPGKYISLKSIQYFDAFPYVGYSWNSYLLEQYVATVSKDYMLMHSSYAKNNTSGAIVRRTAGFESFDEVLADILANASVELEKGPCLEYLANTGYITRKKLSNINEITTRAKMLRSQKG